MSHDCFFVCVLAECEGSVCRHSVFPGFESSLFRGGASEGVDRSQATRARGSMGRECGMSGGRVYRAAATGIWGVLFVFWWVVDHASTAHRFVSISGVLINKCVYKPTKPNALYLLRETKTHCIRSLPPECGRRLPVNIHAHEEKGGRRFAPPAKPTTELSCNITPTTHSTYSFIHPLPGFVQACAHKHSHSHSHPALANT